MKRLNLLPLWLALLLVFPAALQAQPFPASVQDWLAKHKFKTTAAATNAVKVFNTKSAAATVTVYSISLWNSTTDKFVMLFDQPTQPTNGTPSIFPPMYVPGNSNLSIDWGAGRPFTNLWICTSTGPELLTNSAANVKIDVAYYEY